MGVCLGNINKEKIVCSHQCGKKMTTMFSLFRDPGRCVGGGREEVACGREDELPLRGGFHKEGDVLVGKPGKGNDTRDNRVD